MKRRIWWSFAALAAVVLAVVLFATPQVAWADWIVQGGEIPAGEIVDNDVVIYGSDVRVDGVVKGDVIAFGRNVTVNGEVEGSLLVVGREVAVNGDVGGSVYVAALTLKMGSSAHVQNNVHFGGLLLDTQEGSRIGRDLVALALRASVGSEIGRGLNAIIALFSFHGKIGYGLEETGAPSSALPGADTWLFVAQGGRKVAGYAAPLRAPLAKEKEPEEENVVPDWLVTRAGEFVALLFLGLLALWLLPDWFSRAVGRLRAKPLSAAGFGALGVIIFANGVGIALLLSAMLIAVGIWLGGITLWELSALFWGIGFGLLILVISLAALAVFFGSKIVIAYTVLALLAERFAPRLAERRYLVLLLGLILYILLRSIPTLGWVIEAIVVILGTGAIWLALRREKVAPTAEEEALREV